MTKISLTPSNIEYIYDVYHSNAINFTNDSQYLSIQRSIVADEDDDPIFKKCNFATNDGKLAGYLDIEKVIFKRRSLIILLTSIIANGVGEIEVCLSNEIDKQTIDFFVNYLFLGDVAEYEPELDASLHITQVLFQEIV